MHVFLCTRDVIFLQSILKVAQFQDFCQAEDDWEVSHWAQDWQFLLFKQCARIRCKPLQTPSNQRVFSHLLNDVTFPNKWLFSDYFSGPPLSSVSSFLTNSHGARLLVQFPLLWFAASPIKWTARNDVPFRLSRRLILKCCSTLFPWWWLVKVQSSAYIYVVPCPLFILPGVTWKMCPISWTEFVLKAIPLKLISWSRLERKILSPEQGFLTFLSSTCITNLS